MKEDFFIAGIGASAGGHESLQKFFGNLPDDTGVAFIVTTHLLRGHKSALPRILNNYSSIPVTRIRGGEYVVPNHVYVLPENAYCTIKHRRLQLQERPQDNNLNTSIDIFLHSLASDQKEKAVAIIFSGMGSDGANGCVEIHRMGGRVFTEDPETAQFSSMPMAAIIKDHPEEILPAEVLAKNLAEILELKKVVHKR